MPRAARRPQAPRPTAGSTDHSRPTDPQRQGRAQAASRGEGPGGAAAPEGQRLSLTYAGRSLPLARPSEGGDGRDVFGGPGRRAQGPRRERSAPRAPDRARSLETRGLPEAVRIRQGLLFAREGADRLAPETGPCRSPTCSPGPGSPTSSCI